MSTKESSRTRGAISDEVVELGPIDPEVSAQRLQTFPELLDDLESAQPSQRASIADELNELLIAMREPGHEAEETELVLEALESEVFIHQVDRSGRSCRREAVETVMVCGFPHALQLDAEDVQFAREFRARASTTATEEEEGEEAWPRWERQARSARTKGAWLIGLGQLASALLWIRDSTFPLIVVLTLLWAASIGAATLFAFRRPRELNVGAFGAATTVLMITGLLAAAAAKSWALALGPASLGFGLFVGIGYLLESRADPPKPGEWDHWPDDGSF